MSIKDEMAVRKFLSSTRDDSSLSSLIREEKAYGVAFELISVWMLTSSAFILYQYFVNDNKVGPFFDLVQLGSAAYIAYTVKEISNPKNVMIPEEVFKERQEELKRALRGYQGLSYQR